MNSDNIPEHPAAWCDKPSLGTPLDTPPRPPLRAQLRAARARLSDTERAHGAQQLCAQLACWLTERLAMQPRLIITAYWPLAGEPDLRPLWAQWANAGLTVALPVIVARGEALAFRVWTPETALAAGAYGIAEPQGTPLVRPDVLLVPTLGYIIDARGGGCYRLGYGGGYYDRTLAALTAARHPYTAIGIAWDGARLGAADWQPAAHDVALAAVLTPTGWRPAAPA